MPCQQQYKLWLPVKAVPQTTGPNVTEDFILIPITTREFLTGLRGNPLSPSCRVGDGSPLKSTARDSPRVKVPNLWPHVRTPQNSFLLSGERCFISLKFYARISTLEQDEQDFNIANSLPLSCDPARRQGRLRCKWTERRFLSSIQSLLFTVGFSGSQVRLVDMRLVSWIEWKRINGNELACLQLDHWLKRRQWKRSWAPWVTGNQMDKWIKHDKTTVLNPIGRPSH